MAVLLGVHSVKICSVLQISYATVQTETNPGRLLIITKMQITSLENYLDIPHQVTNAQQQRAPFPKLLGPKAPCQAAFVNILSGLHKQPTRMGGSTASWHGLHSGADLA